MKKLMKNMSLVFMFVFCLFFIDMNYVQAKGCSCYYHATENMSSDKYTIYYYRVYISKDGVGDISGKSTTNAINEFSALDSTYSLASVTKGSPFKVNYTNIVDNNCTLGSCNAAKLRYAEGDPLKLLSCGDGCTESENNIWSKGTKLTAMNKSQYVTIENGEDVDPNTSSSTGISDITADDIIKWGNKGTNSLYKNGTLNPCRIIDDELKDLLNTVLTAISVAGIIMLIVMSMIEFIKAVTGANDDLIKTALKHTVIRIICAIILFLLPIIVSGIINIINSANTPVTDANGNTIIGADGNPLCGVGK